MSANTPARVAAAVLIAGVILAGQLGDRAHGATLAPVARTLPACPNDENTHQPQHPCVWIGTLDGNGVGASFRIYRDGRLKMITDARARELRGIGSAS